jgi:hypothetical protein
MPEAQADGFTAATTTLELLCCCWRQQCNQRDHHKHRPATKDKKKSFRAHEWLRFDQLKCMF